MKIEEILTNAGYDAENIDKITKALNENGYCPEWCVPRTRLNEESTKRTNSEEQNKSLMQQIELLKKSVGDNEELANKIKELENENKRIAKENEDKMVDMYKINAIRDALGDKVYDKDYIIMKLNREQITHDQNSYKVLAGLDNQLEAMKQDETLHIQFKEFSNTGISGGYKPQNSNIPQQDMPPKNEISQAESRMMKRYHLDEVK